jgi:hypothetical protein
LGLVPGFSSLRKFGINDVVPATGTADIWPLATQRVLPSAAAVASLVSDSAEDDSVAVGDGARTVRIEGLDENYLKVFQDVITDGVTPSLSTQEFLRVNRAYVISSGVTQVNEGTINISVGGALQAIIPPLHGQTQQAMVTVSAAETLIITSYHIGIGRLTGSVDSHMFLQKKDIVSDSWRTISDVYLGSGGRFHNDTITEIIPEKTDIRVCVESSAVSQADAQLDGFYMTNASWRSR